MLVTMRVGRCRDSQDSASISITKVSLLPKDPICSIDMVGGRTEQKTRSLSEVHSSKAGNVTAESAMCAMQATHAIHMSPKAGGGVSVGCGGSSATVIIAARKTGALAKGCCIALHTVSMNARVGRPGRSLEVTHTVRLEVMRSR